MTPFMLPLRAHQTTSWLSLAPEQNDPLLASRSTRHFTAPVCCVNGFSVISTPWLMSQI